MDIQEFIIIVRKMRQAQNTYFQNGKKYSDLISAKAWEKIVDRALRDGIAIPVEDVLEEMDGTPAKGIQMGLDFPAVQRPTVTPEQANPFPTEEGNDER